ncbi:hypothetical protein D3C87_1129420 [compost metagenome]
MATASTWATDTAHPMPLACICHAASSATASPSAVPRQPRSRPSARRVAHRKNQPEMAASKVPIHIAADQNDTVAASLKVRGAPAIAKPSPNRPIQYLLPVTFSTLALNRTGVLPNLVA